MIYYLSLTQLQEKKKKPRRKKKASWFVREGILPNLLLFVRFFINSFVCIFKYSRNKYLLPAKYLKTKHSFLQDRRTCVENPVPSPQPVEDNVGTVPVLSLA